MTYDFEKIVVIFIISSLSLFLYGFIELVIFPCSTWSIFIFTGSYYICPIMVFSMLLVSFISVFIYIFVYCVPKEKKHKAKTRYDLGYDYDMEKHLADSSPPVEEIPHEEVSVPKRKNLTPKQRHEIWKRDNFTCQYCGRTINETPLEIDHILPVSKGGTNASSNLQTLCQDCNREKYNK